MLQNDIVAKEVIFKKVLRLMGNRFEISVCAEFDKEEWANDCISQAVHEIQRIENLLTTFNENSETNKINAQAGIKPVAVSSEMFNLIERSIKLSQLTQGAFDITYGSIDKKLWNFDTNLTSLPSEKLAKEMVRLVDYRKIILDKSSSTIYLKEKGMRIGFGGIGKGYSAEMAKRVLIKNGVESGIVNAAGDLTTWGKQPDGKPWTIGIVDPDKKDTPFSYLNISGLSVATSGNYEKFAIIDGKKYSHTINPKTGLPVHGIKSVTIICPNAEIADALATPVMVMGTKVGLNLINQIKGVACIVIDEKNNIFTSNNINIK